MSKNIIWILVIGFVLGFISREQWNTESWEFVFLAMQGIGSILVPVMIFWWANKDQKRRDERESERIEQDKKELKLKEDRELEILDLKQFINEKITPYIKEYRQGKLDEYDALDIDLIVKINYEIWVGLFHLQVRAKNTFYNKSILEISGLLFEWYGIARYPIDFSYNIKLKVSNLLTILGDNLYKILIDDDTRREWIWIIQKEKKGICEQLTLEEKDKMKLYANEFFRLNIDIKADMLKK